MLALQFESHLPMFSYILGVSSFYLAIYVLLVQIVMCTTRPLKPLLNSNNHGDYLKFGWANSMHRYFARTHKRPSRPFSLAHSWSEENAHLAVCLKICFKIRSNSSNCTEIGFFPATLTVTDVFQTFF